MSFILDALKKLEQKRQQGAVPDLMTIHATERQVHKKRVIWPYLVLGALVLNAGLLAAVFHPWEDENKKTSPNVPVQTYARKNVPETLSPQVKKDLLVPDMKPVVRKASPSVTKNTTETKKAAQVMKQEAHSAAPEAVIKEPLQAEEPTPNNTQYSNENRASAISLNPSPEDMESLRNKIKEETFHSSGVPSGKDLPVKKAGTGTEEQVPDFSQLPEETKKELPNITISAHIYSNNPRSRIVNINGSTVKEGDEVTRGLRVSEITMSGVILDYQGRRFQVRAF